MSQVQMRCGPFKLTSLISTDSAKALGLEPGRLAAVIVKATKVMVEITTLEEATTR